MPADGFPKRTATCQVYGYKISGDLVEVDEENGLALYYFPNDAVLGDAWEEWLTPEVARSPLVIGALARDNYRALRRPRL